MELFKIIVYGSINTKVLLKAHSFTKPLSRFLFQNRNIVLLEENKVNSQYSCIYDLTPLTLSKKEYYSQDIINLCHIKQEIINQNNNKLVDLTNTPIINRKDNTLHEIPKFIYVKKTHGKIKTYINQESLNTKHIILFQNEYTQKTIAYISRNQQCFLQIPLAYYLNCTYSIVLNNCPMQISSFEHNFDKNITTLFCKYANSQYTINK